MLTHFPASGYSQKLMTRQTPLDRQLIFQSSALASDHHAKQSSNVAKYFAEHPAGRRVALEALQAVGQLPAWG